MFKKIISVILALCVAFGCFSVIASARSVGVGGGAESFNPVVFSQEAASVGSTRVNTKLVAKITDRNYKVEINTISSQVLYLESGDTSNVTVSYQSGTIVEDEVKFSITGDISKNTNSAVRYTVNYDILDKDGNVVWKNLTGYAYGAVSGSAAQTGAIGTYPGMPGDIHSGARFTSLDRLNSCYVQVSSAAMLYTLKTQHFFFTFDERRTETSVISGNAPDTLRTYPVDWPSVMWYYQESEGTWLMWSTPESGYYNFTVDMNANNEKWDDEANTVVSTEMYYLDDWDRVNAQTMSERVLGINNKFADGYYVQKDKYTAESWKTFLDALDMANHVMYAVPGANYGFKLACENGSKADDILTTAFYNLVEAPCDWTSHKDPVVGEQSTCGSGGTMIYTCICGKTKVEATSTTGCNPAEDWTVIVAPTCVNKGEEAQLCTMCSSPVNVRDIKPLGHEYGTTVVDPLCEDQGYTIYTCIRGDHTYFDNYTDPKGHTSGDAVVENEVPSTCLRMGIYEKVVYCSDCDKEISRKIMRTAKVPHTPGEWKVHVEPTAATAGEEWLYCTVCGYEYERRVIPALGPYIRAAKGSETVIDKEKGIIYGLPEYLTDLEGYVEYDGGTLEYIETENGFGTGTTVNFMVDGEVRETYQIVIYGDLNGDGMITEDDIEVYQALINFDVEFEEGSAFKYASDIFFNEGVADTYDLAHLYSVISGEGLIFQNPATDDLLVFDKTLTGNLSVTTVVSDEQVSEGDIITVTVKLSSLDYISNVQIPVIFDKTQFEIVGDSTDGSYLSFAEDSPFADRNYVLGGSADKANGFAMTTDDDTWNTDEAKNKYGYAFITATYNAGVGSDDSDYVLAQGEGFVTFQLKALTDVEDATESVFVDADWAKTADNSDGLLTAGLKKAPDYDPYLPIVPYENVTFTIPTTVVESKQHVPGEKVRENVVEADCTNDGSYDEVCYCVECGGELSRVTVVVPAIGHIESTTARENVVEADCTNDGSYDEVCYCTECDEEISRETVVVPAIGHTESTTVRENVVEADCANDGSYDEVCYCAECGEEISRETAVVPAIGHTESAPVKENEVPAVGSTPASYDLVVYCSVCKEELRRETVTIKGVKFWGTVKSFDDSIDNSDDVTLEFYVDGNEKPVYTFVVTGSGTVNYEFNDVNTGKYTVKVSKASHVTRTYTIDLTENVSDNKWSFEIQLLGDVNGDGKVNTVDVAKVNAHAKNINSLVGYSCSCADINGDGKINTVDVARINAHAKNVSSIW